MNSVFPTTSISKKIVMALTGLALFGFLVSHLAGNFLLFAGPETYNNYSHALISNPLIYLAEAFLVIIFLYHVIIAVKVTIENRAARPVSYSVTESLGEKTIASSTMMWTGIIIFYFLVIHINTFKFGADVTPSSSDGVRNLHALVIHKFHNQFYSLFYVLCMVMLGFHLSHAFQSSMRTLGVSHPRYLSWIKVTSIVLGIFFAVGFSVFPISVYFGFYPKL